MGDLPGGMFSHDSQCLIPDGRPTLHRSKHISLRSTPKGHGKRLAQRQAALAVLATALKDAQHKHAQLAEHVQAVGPSGQRADRDFRKQTIMTIRTLLLENTLRAFMVALFGTLQTKVSLETILHLLFERSGARIETSSQVVYWVNTAGLSVPYR